MSAPALFSEPKGFLGGRRQATPLLCCVVNVESLIFDPEIQPDLRQDGKGLQTPGSPCRIFGGRLIISLISSFDWPGSRVPDFLSNPLRSSGSQPSIRVLIFRSTSCCIRVFTRGKSVDSGNQSTKRVLSAQGRRRFLKHPSRSWFCVVEGGGIRSDGTELRPRGDFVELHIPP